jgi:hypothetical protein
MRVESYLLFVTRFPLSPLPFPLSPFPSFQVNFWEKSYNEELAQLTNQTRGIVGSVLAPACRVWLRSQVSHVDDLHVEIAGGSRQILGGTIPRVAVGAKGAIYQGLALGTIDLVAENIRINLPQVIKGQALRLLEPIAVTAEVIFSEADLQTSLASPLLSQAITDLITQILAADPQHSQWRADWQQLEIAPGTLYLNGRLTTAGQTVPIAISMGLSIADGHILTLDPLDINCAIADAAGNLQPLPGSDLTRTQIDLGNDVQIDRLELLAGEASCHGRIQVNP